MKPYVRNLGQKGPIWVRAAPREDFAWLQLRTGCALTSDFTAIEAIQFQGDESHAYRIRGMVGYCNTTKSAIQVHMAVESPIVWRALLLPGFEYPFQQAGKNILFGVIPAGNTKSLGFAHRVGFKETHRIEDGWDAGEDLVFLEMRRGDCRWLRKPSRPLDVATYEERAA